MTCLHSSLASKHLGVAVSVTILLTVSAFAGQEPLLEAAFNAGDECQDSSGECALNALQRQAAAHKLLLKTQQAPVAKAWAQCGGRVNGKAWDGPTHCEKGYACQKSSVWYSQCVEAKDSLGGEPDEEGWEWDATEPASDGPEPASDDPEEEGFEDEDEDDEPEEEVPEEEESEDKTPQEEGPAEAKDDETPHQVPLKPNPPMPEPRTVSRVSPVVIKGNFLYDSVTGKRFFSKGIAYNPRNTRYDIKWGRSSNCTPGNPESAELAYDADVMTDELEGTWRPALKAIANSGANTVRIYNVDPANNHAKFMEAAAALGLYVIIPLTRKDWGFLPAFPSPDCYTKTIEGYGHVGVNVLTTGKLIVKEFSKYNNTLMFTIANEMTVNDRNGFAAFPCVKAYTRDIHRYQASCAGDMRRVPLLYADMDIGDDRTMIGEYLTCELESPDDAVDAYGINVYSWCDETYPDDTGKPNFNYSPYLSIKKGFERFKKPVLFSEFGCNVGAFQTRCPYSGGRTWPDLAAITGVMGEILSGAIAFEFSMERNEYGLALTPGFLTGQDDLYLLDNYFALQRQFHNHNVSSQWDAENAAEAMASCGWEPDLTVKMATSHVKSTCPAQAKAADLQRRRRTDVVVRWDELPETPYAPLRNVNNQTECPAYEVPRDVYREGCCHMKCGTKK